MTASQFLLFVMIVGPILLAFGLGYWFGRRAERQDAEWHAAHRRIVGRGEPGAAPGSYED